MKDPVHADHHVQHRFPAEARFCAICGAKLELRIILPDRKEHRRCPRCGFVFFPSAKLVAGCVIVEAGRILLLRRGIEPALGKWTYPGGFVDYGESAAEAALRETMEEVGMQVALGAVLGIYFDPHHSKACIAAYLATPQGGEPRPTAEALEVRYFAPDEIPWDELAFRSTHEALTDWVASVRRR